MHPSVSVWNRNDVVPCGTFQHPRPATQSLPDHRRVALWNHFFWPHPLINYLHLGMVHLLDQLGNHLQMLDVKFAHSDKPIKARIWPAQCGPSGLELIRDRRSAADLGSHLFGSVQVSC